MDLVKIVTRETPERLDSVVTDILVKSNVRNRTILLDGRYAVVFDENGLGKLPAQHKALFDREMMMKPGRFSFVEEPVLEVVEAVEVEVPIEAVEVPVEPLVVEEETVDPVDDVPAGLDQSFLVEEVQSPVKKASKKK